MVRLPPDMEHNSVNNFTGTLLLFGFGAGALALCRNWWQPTVEFLRHGDKASHAMYSFFNAKAFVYRSSM